MNRNIYYVYVHLDMDGRIFYVGKGKDRRAWSKCGRNKDWIDVASNGYTVNVVKDGMPECCAMIYEMALIHSIGVGNLTNRSTGGEGSSGAVRSDESKRRYSLSKMGNKSRLGIPHTDATKRKIGDAHRGKIVSNEARINIGNASACKDIVSFKNDDGREFTGIRRDFIAKYGLHKGAVWSVINGRSHHVKGWRLV